MNNYEDIDKLTQLAEGAKKRLNDQINQNDEDAEDLYSDFRKYENSMEDELYKEYPTIDNQSEEDEPLPQIDKYDEPIFEGGPGVKEVQAWKKEWDGYEIYVAEVSNEMFIFRTLNRFEYKQIITLANINSLQREEIICQTVTLWPYNYNWKEMAIKKAGVPSTFSDIIMEKSGFTKDYVIQII